MHPTSRIWSASHPLAAGQGVTVCSLFTVWVTLSLWVTTDTLCNHPVCNSSAVVLISDMTGTSNKQTCKNIHCLTGHIIDAHLPIPSHAMSNNKCRWCYNSTRHLKTTSCPCNLPKTRVPLSVTWIIIAWSQRVGKTKTAEHGLQCVAMCAHGHPSPCSVISSMPPPPPSPTC